MSVEFWTSGAGVPRANARQAVRAEDAGFDGIVYVDSQNLSGDCYIALALAANATSRIKLGTGVTNPVTRHPATTASAIATVQAESGGRAYLGIGRGDSALAHLGYAPASVGVLEDYLQRVQTYLRGDDVPFDADGDVDSLELADQPAGSRLAWLRPDQPKVPVDVAATGPRVIGVAARHADRVSLAVGGDPARIAWGMEVARTARREAGLDGELPFAAYVPLVVHDDPERGRRLGEGGLSLFARFSVMHGQVIGPASEEERATLGRVHDAYDMTRHSQGGSPQAAALSTEFAREFGIYGPPSYCIERLEALVELGVDRFIVVGPAAGARDPEQAHAAERLVKEVIPLLR
jgi:5,10-methylenetetrahydromethanopterin reductase